MFEAHRFGIPRVSIRIVFGKTDFGGILGADPGLRCLMESLFPGSNYIEIGVL